MFDADDMALLRKYARESSEEAFAELVRRHVNMVYSVACRRVGNAHDAQDVTQVVFTILAQKAARLDGRTALTGWLYETTRFASSKFLRTKLRREAREQEACMQSSLNDPEPEQVWLQLAPHLEEAMACLGEKDRALVALRFFEYKSGAQAAAALGMQEWAAHKRAARAVEKLRLFFARRGISVSGGMLITAISAHSVQAAPAGLGTSVATVAALKGMGAGAAGSALIKGTVKLMAWAKIKTAIVVGAGVILVGGVATVIVEQNQAATVVTETNHPLPELDESVWNDDRDALDKAPPMVILRATRFPTDRGGGIMLPENGKMAIRREPITTLLTHAYNVGQTRMVINTPLPETLFDYLDTKPENQREALREQIRVQLGITGRRETRTVPVYLLKDTGEHGPGLIPGPPLSETELKRGHFAGSLSSLCSVLEAGLNAPVLDRTDLTNDFHIDLHWEKDTNTPPAARGPGPAGFTKAVHEQLGLELVSGKEPVEMLVVEQVK